VKDVGNPHNIDPEKIVDRIRTGKSRSIIEQIRMSNNGSRGILKAKLPSITFSGIFKYRNDESIINHSGLIALDFDHVKELDNLKQQIIKDDIVYMAFVSPSGDGLKVIVKIPADVKTHKGSAAALAEYFNGVAVVDHFDDLSRVCYESYDPDIYYNPGSKVFIQIVETGQTKERSFETDENAIFEKIQKWLEKQDRYADGNKHKFLVRFAAACNRFGLSQTFTEQRLYWTYSKTASPVSEKDYQKIVKKIYQLYGNSFASSVFEKEEIIEIKTKRKITAVNLDVSLPIDDIIYLENIRSLMIDSYKNGMQRGETTYFTNIDPHFTWKRGELTLVHGIANHGKSTFLMNMALIKSVRDDYKWGVFSPEQNPPTDFYNDLIHTYVGESTEPYYSNQMEYNDYDIGMEFINEHFFYVYPEKQMATPEYINLKFQELILKHKVDGCIIDPFNQLDHNWDGKRDDKYLSVFLQDQKRFALDNDIFMVIVAHPRGTLQKIKNGDYECPQVYDLSGGAMWNNKCDNIVVIHKPENITDPKSTNVDFISQKIKKQKLVGRPGCAHFIFDIKENRYAGADGLSPFDEAYKEREPLWYEK